MEKFSKILKTITESVSFEVPSALVENEILGQISMFEQRLLSQGINLESYLQMTGSTIEKMKEDIKDKATESVKTSLILSKLSEAENIKVSNEEVEKHLENMATMNGMDLKTLIDYLDKQKQTQEFFSRTQIQLLNEKLQNFLLENN